MSIAIHDGEGWHTRWIEYCRDHGIPYRVVNCYEPDILGQIEDCGGLMWLFNQWLPEDILTARNILYAADLIGLKTYPNFATSWHFDDKISQKYLFEALNLPTPAAWVFYSREKAVPFAESCTLPIVAKLRRGAGSYNVRLLRTRQECRSYVARMFGRGFSPIPAPWADAATKFRVAAQLGGVLGIWRRLSKAPRFVRESLHGRKYLGNEKGYVYLQKFIPGNTTDVRVTVVGNRAWAFQRKVRERDFRASGSGLIDYDTKNIPIGIIEQSFLANSKLAMQSVCFDWVKDAQGKWYFVEVSMGFVDEAVYACEGYWDRNLGWHEGHLYPSIAVLEDFLVTLSH